MQSSREAKLHDEPGRWVSTGQTLLLLHALPAWLLLNSGWAGLDRTPLFLPVMGIGLVEEEHSCEHGLLTHVRAFMCACAMPLTTVSWALAHVVRP